MDDEISVRDTVRKYAKLNGYDAAEATNGLQAIEYCRQRSFDAVILDVLMPELDGFAACREIRTFSDVPIIFLSSHCLERDRIKGFELGADDYVAKPFSPKELMLRVGAILRRRKPDGSGNREIYNSGGLTVDFSGRSVLAGGAKIDLSPKEYELLFYLVKNRGMALSREKILSDVWGFDFLGDERTVDTHIKQLRKALCSAGNHIATVRGIGYRFDE